MTKAEANLIEAVLTWRRLQLAGPVTKDTSAAITRVAAWAEEVIRERNIATTNSSEEERPNLLAPLL